MEFALGWPAGMAISTFVILADISISAASIRGNPHLIGPTALLSLLGCLVLIGGTLWTTQYWAGCFDFCEGADEPVSFANSASWLVYFSAVALLSIAIQVRFAFRYVRYLVQSRKKG